MISVQSVTSTQMAIDSCQSWCVSFAMDPDIVTLGKKKNEEQGRLDPHLSVLMQRGNLEQTSTYVLSVKLCLYHQEFGLQLVIRWHSVILWGVYNSERQPIQFQSSVCTKRTHLATLSLCTYPISLPHIFPPSHLTYNPPTPT